MIVVLFLVFLIREIFLWPDCRQKADESLNLVHCLSPGDDIQSIINEKITKIGEKIFLRGGEYTWSEILVNSTFGERENPIEIVPYPLETAIIKFTSGNFLFDFWQKHWWMHNGHGSLKIHLENGVGTPILVREAVTLGPFDIVMKSGTYDSLIKVETSSKIDGAILQHINFTDTHNAGIGNYITIGNFATCQQSQELGENKAVWIKDCYMEDIDSDYVVVVEEAAYVTIEYNYFVKKCDDSFMGFVKITDSYAIFIQNNIFDFDTAVDIPGANFFELETSGSLENVVVQNNLIMCREFDVFNGHVFRTKGSNGMSNVMFDNNYIKGNCSYSGIIFDDVNECLSCNFRMNLMSYDANIKKGPNSWTITETGPGDMDIRGDFNDTLQKPVPFYRVLSNQIGTKYTDSPTIDFDGKVKASSPTIGAFEYMADPCTGTNWDPDTLCTSCKPPFAVGDHNNCNSCIGNRNASDNCVSCRNAWKTEEWSYPDCTHCPYAWDKFEDCGECQMNFDIDEQCGDCINHYSLSHDCTICTNDGWDLSKECTECYGNYDETLNCKYCTNNWEGPNCTVCPKEYKELDPEGGRTCKYCSKGYKKVKDGVKDVCKKSGRSAALIALEVFLLLSTVILCTCIVCAVIMGTGMYMYIYNKKYNIEDMVEKYDEFDEENPKKPLPSVASYYLLTTTPSEREIEDVMTDLPTIHGDDNENGQKKKNYRIRKQKKRSDLKRTARKKNKKIKKRIDNDDFSLGDKVKVKKGKKKKKKGKKNEEKRLDELIRENEQEEERHVEENEEEIRKLEEDLKKEVEEFEGKEEERTEESKDEETTSPLKFEEKEEILDEKEEENSIEKEEEKSDEKEIVEMEKENLEGKESEEGKEEGKPEETDDVEKLQKEKEKIEEEFEEIFKTESQKMEEEIKNSIEEEKEEEEEKMEIKEEEKIEEKIEEEKEEEKEEDHVLESLTRKFMRDERSKKEKEKEESIGAVGKVDEKITQEDVEEMKNLI